MPLRSLAHCPTSLHLSPSHSFLLAKGQPSLVLNLKCLYSSPQGPSILKSEMVDAYKYYSTIMELFTWITPFIYFTGDHPDDDQLLKSPHEGGVAHSNLFLYHVSKIIPFVICSVMWIFLYFPLCTFNGKEIEKLGIHFIGNFQNDSAEINTNWKRLYIYVNKCSTVWQHHD